MLFLCGKTKLLRSMQTSTYWSTLHAEDCSWNIGLNRMNVTQSIWTLVQQHPFEQKEVLVPYSFAYMNINSCRMLIRQHIPWAMGVVLLGAWGFFLLLSLFCLNRHGREKCGKLLGSPKSSAKVSSHGSVQSVASCQLQIGKIEYSWCKTI